MLVTPAEAGVPLFFPQVQQKRDSRVRGNDEKGSLGHRTARLFHKAYCRLTDCCA